MLVRWSPTGANELNLVHYFAPTEASGKLGRLPVYLLACALLDPSYPFLPFSPFSIHTPPTSIEF